MPVAACPNCGARVFPPERACPECGKDLPTDLYPKREAYGEVHPSQRLEAGPETFFISALRSCGGLDLVAGILAGALLLFSSLDRLSGSVFHFALGIGLVF